MTQKVLLTSLRSTRPAIFPPPAQILSTTLSILLFTLHLVLPKVSKACMSAEKINTQVNLLENNLKQVNYQQPQDGFSESLLVLNEFGKKVTNLQHRLNKCRNLISSQILVLIYMYMCYKPELCNVVSDLRDDLHDIYILCNMYCMIYVS